MILAMAVSMLLMSRTLLSGPNYRCICSHILHYICNLTTAMSCELACRTARGALQEPIFELELEDLKELIRDMDLTFDARIFRPAGDPSLLVANNLAFSSKQPRF
jgi:hypothetical protein